MGQATKYDAPTSTLEQQKTSESQVTKLCKEIVTTLLDKHFEDLSEEEIIAMGEVNVAIRKVINEQQHG